METPPTKKRKRKSLSMFTPTRKKFGRSRTARVPTTGSRSEPSMPLLAPARSKSDSEDFPSMLGQATPSKTLSRSMGSEIGTYLRERPLSHSSESERITVDKAHFLDVVRRIEERCRVTSGDDVGDEYGTISAVDICREALEVLSESDRSCVDEELDEEFDVACRVDPTTRREQSVLKEEIEYLTAMNAMLLHQLHDTRGAAAPKKGRPSSPRSTEDVVEIASGSGTAGGKTLPRVWEKKVFGFTPSSKKTTMKVTASHKSIVKGMLLGQGGSGARVHACTVGGWGCAVKEMSTERRSPEDVRCFDKEVEIMRQMKAHPNVVQYLFHIKTPKVMSVFMSRYSMTLRQFLDTLSEPLPEEDVATILLAIIRGVHHIHSFNIVHCDLKADNVFITLNHEGGIDRVAVADFDAAVFLESDQFQAESATAGWAAPEFLGKAVRDRKPAMAWDVYSFGMMMFEVMTREVPFFHVDNARAVSAAVLAGKRPKVPEHSKGIYRRMLWSMHKDCVQMKAKDRPSTELLAHVLSMMLETPHKELSYSALRKSFESLKKRENAEKLEKWKTNKSSIL